MPQRRDFLKSIAAGAAAVPFLSSIPYFLGVNLMETLAKVVDRSELHVLNHAGHFVFAEHPSEVTRLITGFVDG